MAPGSYGLAGKGGLSLARRVSLGCVVCGLLPLLMFAVATIAEARRSSSQQQEARLQTQARIQADALSAMFSDWQRAMLVLARNDAFVSWYLDPPSRVRLDGSIQEALVVLEQVYPNMVDEACFIDLGGQELVRTAVGQPAGPEELSSDESSNPFFAPTVALPVGSVLQHEPYISPDSGRWVVSNSTMLAVAGQPKALLHMETSLDSVRTRLAQALPADMVVQVTDGAGRLVLDTSLSQPIVDAPLIRAATLPPKGTSIARAAVSMPANNDIRWTVLVTAAAEPAVGRTLVWLGAIALTVLIGVLAWARYLSRILHRAGSGVRESAEGLAGVATRLAELTERLDRNASAAVVGIGEVATASGRIASSVAEVERSTSELVASFGEIDSAASTSAEVASRAVSTSASSHQRLEDLRSAAGEIDSVVTLIDDLAARTNLLALNASIESARAGDVGRGFAVVATEVKDLARQTSTSVIAVTEKVGAITAQVEGLEHSLEGLGEVVENVESSHVRIAGVLRQQFSVAAGIGVQLGELAQDSGRIGDAIGVVNDTAVAVAESSTATAAAVDELRRSVAWLTNVVHLIDR
ncbi:MAG: methyl-accepting chemotaxis protein [Acidimicrobiales bacterium]